MKVESLDHLVLTVADIERTIGFYKKLLGMEEVTFGNGRKALSFGKQKINLHQKGQEFEPKALVPYPGSADLCFITETPVLEYLDFLASNGVPIEEGPVRRTGANGSILSIYIRDPDGNLLEISNYVVEPEEDIKLVEPSLDYQAEFLDMIREWEATGEKLVPFVLRMDCSDFESYVQILNRMKTEPTDGKKTVNSSTYWLVNGQRKVLGAVNIRHELNEHLLKIGGHIGFGIRPSERGRGYATRQLALALRIARDMGLRNVLVTCDEDNAASRKTILRNGGILENETFFNGKMIQRFWIEL